jgi:hypothetical protein
MQEPTPAPPSRADAIENLILEGKKIAAIKLYRETTGHDLKQSKQAIEDLEASLRIRCPECFTRPAGGKGCTISTTMILVALTTSSTLAYLTLTR